MAAPSQSPVAPADHPVYDFEAALSFAGEDREYVEQVNEALKAAGVRTFLDSDYLADTWGEDLVEFFDGVYRKRSRFAILFLSRHYAEKAWPRHERRSALARAIEERGAYVLPVRLDDTEVEGLRPTVGYLDTRKVGIDGLVRALLAKLAGRSGWPDGWPGDRSPRTQREVDEVRSERPGGWEYLYFAGVLHGGKQALEPKYLDYELGFAEPTGERIEDLDASTFMGRATAEVRGLVGRLSAMMEPGVQQRAFGVPGEEGDPERIERLAQRWNSIYEGLLDWAARIRGASHSDRWDRAFDLVAQLADDSIQKYRQFVDDFVAQVDRVPSALAAHEPLVIALTLTLSVSDGVVEDLGAELDKIVEEIAAEARA